MKEQMRETFAEALCEIAKNDERICLIIGDWGAHFYKHFAKYFPKRFFNLGIAEQNMAGVAAGLALEGKIPFLFTIASFMSMRCIEQVRNNLCYQNLNAKIIGVGAGVDYGFLGPTHHAIEDMGMMRSIPNMAVVSPADPMESGKIVPEIIKYAGPVYVRIPREESDNIHLKDYKFVLGKATVLKKGNDVSLIATGTILKRVIEAAEALAEEKIDARIINMHTIKPIDEKIILKAASETKAILTIEEHNIIGGLGSAVSEVLAESQHKIPFRRMGIEDKFCTDFGSHDHLLDWLGLTKDNIIKTAKSLLK